MNGSAQLVDERGRKYLTTDERQRFIRAAAHVRKPVDQTFVLTIVHTGARVVSEVLALRALDVDLDAGAVRIRTLKRRVEHWREVPLPPELARDLEMVHYLREASPRRIGKPLWKFSRATAHRKVVAVMRMARIEGPQACPKGLRHAFGIAAVTAGVPLPTIAAVLGHADIATTAIYTTAVGVEARGFLAKMWSAPAGYEVDRQGAGRRCLRRGTGVCLSGVVSCAVTVLGLRGCATRGGSIRVAVLR